MFWVVSVYFNIRNTLQKSGTFLLGHPVYIYIYIYFHNISTLVHIKHLDLHETNLFSLVFLLIWSYGCTTNLSTCMNRKTLGTSLPQIAVVFASLRLATLDRKDTASPSYRRVRLLTKPIAQRFLSSPGNSVCRHTGNVL